MKSATKYTLKKLKSRATNSEINSKVYFKERQGNPRKLIKTDRLKTIRNNKEMNQNKG